MYELINGYYQLNVDTTVNKLKELINTLDNTNLNNHEKQFRKIVSNIKAWYQVNTNNSHKLELGHFRDEITEIPNRLSVYNIFGITRKSQLRSQLRRAIRTILLMNSEINNELIFKDFNLAMEKTPYGLKELTEMKIDKQLSDEEQQSYNLIHTEIHLDEDQYEKNHTLPATAILSHQDNPYLTGWVSAYHKKD